MMDALPTVAATRQRNDTFARQSVPRADHWMTGEGNLASRCEDPQPAQHLRVVTFKHEDRLGEIHLACDLQHHFITQTRSIRKHGERISREGVIGEHVELQETILTHGWVIFSRERRSWKAG